MIKIILSTVLLLFPTASAFFGSNLTDIEYYPWRESIEYLEQQNIIEGYSNNTYQPFKQINRAEFTKIVVGAVFNQSDIASAGQYCFPDVGAEWFAPYVCLAKQEGIVGGYPDGLFKPQDTIKQSEALKIIFETFYTDIPPSDIWYQTYLDEATYQGMGYFKPEAAATHLVSRGEMAYFIAWLLNEDGTDQIKLTEQQALLGITPMTAADCYEDEYFSQQDQLCYLKNDNNNFKIEDWSNQHNHHQVNNEENAYIRYKVIGDTIEFYEDASNFTPELNNKAVHSAIWQTFTKLIPIQYRANIDFFDVMVSSQGNAAHVEPVNESLSSWILAIDVNEFSLPGPNDEYKEFVATLVHELGHTLSLNNTQIDSSIYQATDCRPKFYIQEGCALQSSILQQYYHTFWAKEVSGIYNGKVDIDDYGEALYQQYPNHFINEYAASNTVEDLAEHLAYFVMKQKPAAVNSRVDEKLLFFYQIPEMVDLRNRIRRVLETQL
jgi:hypothetical protein